MWGKPPFFIGDNYAVDVKNLTAAREWYKEKLTLRESQTHREEDSGRPFVDLQISKDDETMISLVELPAGASSERRHVIFFTRNLDKAYQWFAGRGVVVEPPTTDSGGNRFFLFHDLEGNKIEVCIEPG